MACQVSARVARGWIVSRNTLIFHKHSAVCTRSWTGALGGVTDAFWGVVRLQRDSPLLFLSRRSGRRRGIGSSTILGRSLWCFGGWCLAERERQGSGLAFGWAAGGGEFAGCWLEAAAVLERLGRKCRIAWGDFCASVKRSAKPFTVAPYRPVGETGESMKGTLSASLISVRFNHRWSSSTTRPRPCNLIVDLRNEWRSSLTRGLTAPRQEPFSQTTTGRFLCGRPFQTQLLHSAGCGKDRRPCLGWMHWAAQTVRGRGRCMSPPAPRYLKPPMTGCRPTRRHCSPRTRPDRS